MTTEPSSSQNVASFIPVIASLLGFIIGASLTYLFDLKKMRMLRKKEFDLQQVNSLLNLLKQLLMKTRGEIPKEKEIKCEIVDQLYAESVLVISLEDPTRKKLTDLYSACLNYNEYLETLARTENSSRSDSIKEGQFKVSDKAEEQKRKDLENLIRAIVEDIKSSYVNQ